MSDVGYWAYHLIQLLTYIQRPLEARLMAPKTAYTVLPKRK